MVRGRRNSLRPVRTYFLVVVILIQLLLLYNARIANRDCQAMLFSLMPYVNFVPPSGNLFDDTGPQW
jgi:hypothetical protein